MDNLNNFKNFNTIIDIDLYYEIKQISKNKKIKLSEIANNAFRLYIENKKLNEGKRRE